MNFSIEPIQIKDIKEVRNVAKSTWESTYNNIIPKSIQKDFLEYAYSDEIMNNRVNNDYFYVVRIKNHIVGFAEFSRINDKKVEIKAIYLLPKYQRNGIGKSLIQRAISDMKNVEHLIVDVEKENKIGNEFYLRNGFKIDLEFIEDFNGHSLNTLKMSLTLNPDSNFYIYEN
jgi:ribosomal protein S18 acetylase RimI-like enzyme